MSEIIGSYSPVGPSGEQLSLTMHPDSFALRWSVCGLTANFAAEYFVELLDDSAMQAPQRAETLSAVSYVVNELIENAVKFNVGGDVGVSIGIDRRDLVCEVTNQIAAESAPELRAKLAELASGDPGELMLARVEANAELGEEGGSGLGFLLIMNDYGTSLGWKLEPMPGGRCRIRTTARIPFSIER